MMAPQHKNTPLQEYPAVRNIYSLYGKESELEPVRINAPHNYNIASREPAYDLFARKVLALANGHARELYRRSKLRASIPPVQKEPAPQTRLRSPLRRIPPREGRS